MVEQTHVRFYVAIPFELLLQKLVTTAIQSMGTAVTLIVKLRADMDVLELDLDLVLLYVETQSFHLLLKHVMMGTQ